MPNATYPHALARALTQSNSPYVIDVRRQPAFEASDGMIPGSEWRDPEHLAEWITTLDAQRSIVLYCVHGMEVSQNCAALLEAVGFDATYLVGGYAAWVAGAHPTKPKR